MLHMKQVHTYSVIVIATFFSLGGTAGTGKAISISTSGSMDSAVDKKKSAALDR